MNNHLAIAEAFVQELHRTHQDIVAILLTGSVARQQSAPFSDIDLMVVVSEGQEKQIDRSGSTWRDGIYIDVGFRPQNTLTQLEQVLSNPRAATAIAFGMILYDPTEFLAVLQTQVKEQYMQLRWLNVRMQAAASHIQSRLELLRAAIEVQDTLQICIHAGRVVFGIALLPLLHRGFAPSSTRNLMQVAEIAPEVAEGISALEGSADMTKADVEAAYDTFAQLTSLGDTTRWGQLPVYMARKVEWMIHNGLEKAAVHTMWNNIGFRINDCLATPGVADNTQPLAQAWLRQTGWTGKSTLAAKYQGAKALFDRVSSLE